MNKHTALVTGGAGFIGSHLVDKLISNNISTIILDDLSGGSENNINPNAIYYNGSVLKQSLIKEIFNNHDINYVYHFAAYAAEGLSHFIRRYNYQNNLIGSVNLINESIKHEIDCFLFASSVAVYGGGNPPFEEHQHPRPEDPYGIAKFAVEQDLKCAHDMFGLNHVVFRPHNVYGERQNVADMYRNVIGIFMNNLIQGKKLPIFGDGDQTRAFSYVHDLVDIIIHAATDSNMYNQCFNIGSEEYYSVNKLAELVQDSLSIYTGIKHLEQRMEVKHAYCSHQKLKDYYPYEIKETNIREGLSKMAAWVKNQKHVPTSKFSEIEILKKLPPSWS